VGDALRDVVTRKRGQPLAGVLLVTDGANNTGAQPLESAAALRQEGVPVYVYGVGITSPRDIIVANLFRARRYVSLRTKPRSRSGCARRV
jgi:hypothetical protein